MGVPIKPITQSRTTATVLHGGIAAGGPVLGILYGIRTAFPSLLPWDPELDAVLATALTAALTPVFSRLLARR